MFYPASYTGGWLQGEPDVLGVFLFQDSAKSLDLPSLYKSLRGVHHHLLTDTNEIAIGIFDDEISHAILVVLRWSLDTGTS